MTKSDSSKNIEYLPVNDQISIGRTKKGKPQKPRSNDVLALASERDTGQQREGGNEEAGVLVVDMSTGDAVKILCGDPSQVVQAARGTAEALDRALLGIPKVSGNTFAMINQKKAASLLKNKTLTSADIKVWAYCCCVMSYGGKIKETQIGIADSLKMGETTVRRSFAKFVELRVFRRLMGKYGRPEYKVSEKYIIKGKRELVGTDKIASQSKPKKTARG